MTTTGQSNWKATFKTLLLLSVLGGVLVGTCSTLLFVPLLYSVLRTGEAKPLEDYI